MANQAAPTTPIEAVPAAPLPAAPAGGVDTSALAGSVPVPTDMTIWHLFLQSDVIVKIVIILLIVASFWSWTIIFNKVIRLRRLRARAKQFEESFWSGGSLEDLFDRIGDRP